MDMWQVFSYNARVDLQWLNSSSKSFVYLSWLI
jgi:hypothetical protein